MLNTAVQEEKGETVQEPFETTIDISLDAFIPDTYIRDEFQKLDIYKRIAAIEDEADYDDMLEELIDRFGELPRTVQNLLTIALLKGMAHRLYFTEVKQNEKEVKLTMYERAKIDPSGIPLLINKYNHRLLFRGDQKAPYFIYDISGRGPKDQKTVTERLKELFADMQQYLAEKTSENTQ